jgi:hypothetical protein
MEKFINNTFRENPEWIPVPVASRTPEGKVTIKDVLPLGDPSNPLRKNRPRDTGAEPRLYLAQAWNARPHSPVREAGLQ